MVKDDVPDGDYTVEFGRSRVAREGTDVTLVAWSAAVQLSLRAADELERQGISAKVLDLRTLVPLDIDGLAEAVADTGRAVVVHEAPMSAGFGAEVIATVQEECFYHLDAPLGRVTSPDAPYPLAGIEEEYLPSVERVVAMAIQTVNAV